MRFALTDDEIAFRDAVRELLAKESPSASSTYDALVAMGVLSVLVPESDGGLGMDEVAMVAILEETGYVALEHPILTDTMGGDPDRLALGAAAQLVGLGQRMLDMTVDYAKQREQFGVPIGSFQAVKHHLADALKELAFAPPRGAPRGRHHGTPGHLDGQGHGVRRRRLQRSPGAAVPRRHRLHRRARPAPLPQAHLDPRPHPRRRGMAPRARRPSPGDLS
jgi:hypothetical protein